MCFRGHCDFDAHHHSIAMQWTLSDSTVIPRAFKRSTNKAQSVTTCLSPIFPRASCVRSFCSSPMLYGILPSRGGFERCGDEPDSAPDSGLLVVNAAGFDCSDRLYSAQHHFGCSQSAQTLTVSEKPFHRGLIASYSVVAPFTVDPPDVWRQTPWDQTSALVFCGCRAS